MINVTKSSLPPLEEYIAYLKEIWDRNHLTNAGPLVLELEQKLQQYLHTKHLFYVANGTIALQIAIKALAITGEIITTPFSYVATTSSIVWENCTPVFVDIDEKTLTIDPQKIEAAITDNTQAILATHVYGHPCAIHEIAAIAKKYNLKVIYDAAHSFGVVYQGTPLVNYGDISTLSHHATKLFHTVEGGSVICNDDGLAKKISYMRNFGHNGPEAFFGVGINGKNSELHAAMGLCLLPNIETSIKKREKISKLYDSYLLQSKLVTRPTLPKDTIYNYSYYPLLFQNEKELQAAIAALHEHNINPRRYFYPALSTLNYVKSTPMPIAESIAHRVLCLPLYDDLPEEMAKKIAQLVLQSSNASLAIS